MTRPALGRAVVMLPWDGNGWALVVQPGSDVADLYRALAEMPAGLELAAVHEGLDLVLVYRPRAGLASRRDMVTVSGAVLDVSAPSADGSRWMTGGEQHAYRAGYAEAVTMVRLFLSSPAGGGLGGADVDRENASSG